MIRARVRNIGIGLPIPHFLPRSSVLKAFFHSPLQTGAITASGAKLSRRLISLGGVDRADVIVELGAGSGVVTEHILSACKPESTLVALELDPELASETNTRCPRAIVVNEDARNIGNVLLRHGHSSCDSIVSCIPWANMSPSSQITLLDAVESALEPGGSFVTFAYLHSSRLPRARSFYLELCRRYKCVETSKVIWANLPPAIVYRANKELSPFGCCF